MMRALLFFACLFACTAAATAQQATATSAVMVPMCYDSAGVKKSYYNVEFYTLGRNTPNSVKSYRMDGTLFTVNNAFAKSVGFCAAASGTNVTVKVDSVTIINPAFYVNPIGPFGSFRCVTCTTDSYNTTFNLEDYFQIIAFEVTNMGETLDNIRVYNYALQQWFVIPLRPGETFFWSRQRDNATFVGMDITTLQLSEFGNLMRVLIREI